MIKKAIFGLSVVASLGSFASTDFMDRYEPTNLSPEEFSYLVGQLPSINNFKRKDHYRIAHLQTHNAYNMMTPEFLELLVEKRNRIKAAQMVLEDNRAARVAGIFESIETFAIDNLNYTPDKDTAEKDKQNKLRAERNEFITKYFDSSEFPVDKNLQSEIDNAKSDYKEIKKNAPIMKVNGMKVFIHYTQKWNKYLDSPGKGASERLMQKFLSEDHLTKKENDLNKSNTTWTYNVAPAFMVDGEIKVFERALKLPYNAPADYSIEQAGGLIYKNTSPESWVEAQTVRGELLWNIRKKTFNSKKVSLDRELRISSSKNRKQEIKKELEDINNTMSVLEMDSQDSLDITCKNAANMSAVDLGQSSEWCFYSVTPMYYYNQLDLRAFTFGAPKSFRNYSYPVLDVELHENKNVEKSQAIFSQNKFNEVELKDARREYRNRNFNR
jgi:hypothetical protein